MCVAGSKSGHEDVVPVQWPDELYAAKQDSRRTVAKYYGHAVRRADVDGYFVGDSRVLGDVVAWLRQLLVDETDG